MQVQNSQMCIYCTRPMRVGAMKYLLSEMAVEMLTWVELKLKHEVNEHSWLCEQCFTSFHSSWSAIQEPEVMDFSDSVEPNPDPLMVNRCLTEEVHIKTEDESKSFEHYDYKVEIDTSQPHSEGSHEKLESDFDDDDDDEYAESEKILSSDDEMEELSSDEEAKAMFSESPLLNGSLLKSGTRCDGCRTLLTKQSYRKLSDGPEKDFFVVNERSIRDVSPERVCNPCFLKAHTAVMKQNKIRKKSGADENKNSDPSEVKSITVPGYQRFAKSSSRCMIRNCKSNNRLHVPQYLRIILLKFYNIYASTSSRICQTHSKEYNRDWSFLREYQYGTKFSAKDVSEMLDLLREDALKHPD